MRHGVIAAAGCALAVAMVSASRPGAMAPVRGAAPATLPAPTAREVIENYCLTCHDKGLLLAAR